MSTHPIAQVPSDHVSNPVVNTSPAEGVYRGRRFSLNCAAIVYVVMRVADAVVLVFVLIRSAPELICTLLVFAGKRVCWFICFRLVALFARLFPSIPTQEDLSLESDSSEDDTSISSAYSSDDDTSTSSTVSSEDDQSGEPILISYGHVEMIISPHDVASFSLAYSKETSDFYRTQGYSGINALFLEDLSTLIDEQNYAEILKSIWTEEDLDCTINFLEPYAQGKHPILMLELSRTFCRKMALQGQFCAETYKEAWKWFVLGVIHVKLDIMCTRNHSPESVFKTLIKAYHPRKMTSENEERAFFAENEEFKKSLEALSTELRLDDVLYPSPKWIAYHGWQKSSLHPEEMWGAMRLRGIQYLNEHPLRIW